MSEPGATHGPSERGATVVEFAFVVPVLLLLLIGMIDIGLVIMGNSAGSNGVRDGARVGIIKYEDADVDGSASSDAIKSAVTQRVVGLLRGTPAIAIRCIDGDSVGANPPSKSCNSAIEPGYDVIEVKLTWQHVGVTPFVTNTNHVDIARLVIVGDVDLTQGTPPPLQLRADSPSIVEGGPGETPELVFTVSRSHNGTDATVDYATGIGGSPSATSGSDYAARSGSLSFPAGGTLTHTVSVPIIGDAAIEGDEQFALVLSNPTTSSGTVQAAGGIGTIVNDDFDTTAPVLQDVQIFDNDGDGRLDYLVATFDEPLLASCPGSWSFSDASGGSVQTAAVSGSTVQVFLTEGAGFNTGPSVTVTSNGTCDASGNAAGAQSGPIVDRAAPRVVGIGTAVTGSTQGRAQAGDQLTITMSESVSGVPATTTVTLNGGNGSNSDSMTISGITTSGALGRSDYISSNNGTATFASSTTSVSGSTITVTLGPVCTGNRCGSATQANSTAAGTGVVVVNIVSTIVDGASNAAAGVFNSPAIRLF